MSEPTIPLLMLILWTAALLWRMVRDDRARRKETHPHDRGSSRDASQT